MAKAKCSFQTGSVVLRLAVDLSGLVSDTLAIVMCGMTVSTTYLGMMTHNGHGHGAMHVG